MSQPSRFSGAGGGPAPAGAGGSNAFTRQLGPLPTWGWMAVGLAIALVYYVWQRNKKNNTATQGTDVTQNPDQTTASSQIPQFVIQDIAAPNYATSNSTSSATSTATSTTPPSPPMPPPHPGGGHPPPGHNPGPGQRYITVKVGKFPTGSGGTPTAKQNSFGPGTAAWNSTLWGIATHYNVEGGYQTLAKLNHIQNPNLIFPGQQIRVPVNG